MAAASTTMARPAESVRRLRKAVAATRRPQQQQHGLRRTDHAFVVLGIFRIGGQARAEKNRAEGGHGHAQGQKIEIGGLAARRQSGGDGQDAQESGQGLEQARRGLGRKRRPQQRGQRPEGEEKRRKPDAAWRQRRKRRASACAGRAPVLRQRSRRRRSGVRMKIERCETRRASGVSDESHGKAQPEQEVGGFGGGFVGDIVVGHGLLKILRSKIHSGSYSVILDNALRCDCGQSATVAGYLWRKGLPIRAWNRFMSRQGRAG